VDARDARRENLPMTHHQISASAALLADPTRVAMVLALMDGRARSAKKLALDAGVTPQTASAHLRKLVDASMLAWEGEGRCKHFRIAGAEVAHAVEALCELGSRNEPERALPAPARPLRFARCCYDHLAGQLGVDWTERRPHIAGSLGAALLTAYQDHGWLVRVPESRRLDLTPRGREGLNRLFGLKI
jgi:DNA-binding transcriptional ArsR family regulator